MSNNFEIIWPTELVVTSYDTIEATVQPTDEIPISNESSTEGVGDIILVCGAIVAAGVAFTLFNDRNARDTAERKQKQRDNSI